jgi:hypothetical protein
MIGKDLALPDDYEQVLAELKQTVRAANVRARQRVNTELLRLYWTVGRVILTQQAEAGWGAKVIDRLANDLGSAFRRCADSREPTFTT